MLKHVRDVPAPTRTAFPRLRPGRLLAIVTQDDRAPICRLLRRRSAIIDIEHRQRLCRASPLRLVAGTGLTDIAINPLRNFCPLRDGLRALPIEGAMKTGGISCGDAIGSDRLRIGRDFGNLLTVARKSVAPVT